MSGWFGALVGAPTALDAETTPPKCGEASMMKKGLAGVGICGCMTSLNWVNWEGISGCFEAVVGAPRALDAEITPPRCG